MDNRILQIILRAKDEASKTLKQVGQQTEGLSKLFRDNYKEAGLMSGAILGGLALAGKYAIANAASYEQNRIAFESMLGSAEDARKLLSKVSDFAKQTPFELPQVVEGSKRLLAYNIEAEKIIPTFKMLGDIASGVGTDKLPQLITAFGQVQSKGKLMGTELLQFTEAGVGLGQELQKSFGVTREELEKMISSGDVTADQVTEALQRMTGEGGLFFQGMARQSHSFNGIMSNIQDSFGKFVRDVAGITEQGDIREGSLFFYLKQGAEKLLPMVEKAGPKVAEFIEKITKNKGAIFGIVGALTALALFVAGAFVVAFAGPIAVMLGVVAAGAAIGAIAGFIMDNWGPISGFFQGVSTAISDAINWIGGKVTWFKDHWAEAIGFVIGFVATLPIKLPSLMSQAVSSMVSKILEIDWRGVFSNILTSAQSIFGGIQTAAFNAWSYLKNLNWGGILSGIGRSIGNAIIGLLEGAINGALSGIPGVPYISFPRFAKGTSFAPGGWAIVGEEGPELINLPRGSQVLPAGQTQSILNRNSNIQVGPVYVTSMADVDSMAYRLGFHLQTAGNL